MHLRTTTPIESPFSTVKLRAKVTGGAGSPAVPLAMVFRSSSPPRPAGARSPELAGRLWSAEAPGSRTAS